MYQYIGTVKTYDIIGLIALIYASIASFYILKKSDCFLGNFSCFSINFFQKRKSNTLTKKFSSPKFWTKFEKKLILITLIFSFSIGERILRENVSFVTRDFYNIIFLTSLLLMIVLYFLRLNCLKILDLLVPVFAFSSFILKHACFFTGCCYGFEYAYGFFNNKTQATEFPVQLLEAYFSLIIFFMLLFYKKRIKKDGLLFPLFLIFYSTGRIISSFFRNCDDEIFSFITDYQCMSISALAFGILLLFFVSKYQDQILAFFSRESFPGYMKYKRSFAKQKNHSNKRKK